MRRKLNFLLIVSIVAVVMLGESRVIAQLSPDDGSYDPRFRERDAEGSAGDLAERLSRLETMLESMQQQIANGVTASDVPVTAPQQIVSYTEIEEQLRQLRGQVEELSYQVSQLQSQLQTQQQLFASSLKAAASPQQPASPELSPAPPTAPATPDATPASQDASKPKVFQKVEPADVAAGKSKEESDTMRKSYEDAFDLLKNEKYEQASTAFVAFVEKYPNEQLTENAYYWLAESYYARGDYQQAAVEFLKGYQAFPLGTKAPDNLLKLAVSLGKIDKKTEACGTLDKLNEEFPNASLAIKQRSNKEYAELDCS